MAAATGNVPFFGSSFEGKTFSLADNHAKKKGMCSEMSKMLSVATISVALGCALPSGFNFSVLNAPQSILQEFCNNTISAKLERSLTGSELELIWSCIVAVFLFGGMIGAAVGGWVCDLMGRRRALLLNQLFGLAAAVLFIGSKPAYSVTMIFLGRILAGFYSGFTFGVVPVYLTEISPVALRGALGVIQQTGLNVGILVAQILGLKHLLGTEENWNYLLGCFAIPIILFSILLFFCPESPKYLFIIKEDQAAALRELSRLRGLPEDQMKEDIGDLRESMKVHQSETKWSLWRLLRAPELRLPLLLLCVLQGVQQLSGISVVFYYSTSIFIKAGISEENSQYAGIGACIINSSMATLAMVFVTKYTRKSLLRISLTGIVVFLILLTISLEIEGQWMAIVAVITLLCYVLVYGVGLGPIPFFLGAELFRQGPKPAAMSIGCWVNWTCNLLYALSFPTLQRYIGAYCFLISAIIVAISLVFIQLKLPETKDKHISEISKYFLDLYKRSNETSVGNEGDIMLSHTSSPTTKEEKLINV